MRDSALKPRYIASFAAATAGRRIAHARQRCETVSGQYLLFMLNCVGEELMRDSALKLGRKKLLKI